MRDLDQFFRIFCAHLPCPTCRQHAVHYLDRHLTKEALASREDAVRFINNFHNAVNHRKGKPEFTLAQHYDAMDRCRYHSLGKQGPSVFAVLLLLLTLAVVVRRKSSRRYQHSPFAAGHV